MKVRLAMLVLAVSMMLSLHAVTLQNKTSKRIMFRRSHRYALQTGNSDLNKGREWMVLEAGNSVDLRKWISTIEFKIGDGDDICRYKGLSSLKTVAFIEDKNGDVVAIELQG